MQTKDHYSAEVRIRFETNGQSYELAKIGHKEIYFKRPVELSACEGIIVLKIDGRPQTWRVRLNEDVVPFSESVGITDLPE